MRRTRNTKVQLGRDMRRSNLALFVQQVEKEAQERMNELEAKMVNMLATVDKVFEVEVMKMPLSLQSTLMGDLINKEDFCASDVSIVMKNESFEMQQPLKRVPSKRVKTNDSPTVQSLKSSSKISKGGKGTRKTRTVGSVSTGNLGASSVMSKRTRSRVTKTSEQTKETKPKLRSVVSTGDLPCSMVGSAAHVTVTTALGQTVCFSEETKDEINLAVLDDVAWCQIQKLTSLMEYLSRQSRCQR